MFDARMPTCLLDFMDFIINDLSENLNAQFACHENDELEMISGYGLSFIKNCQVLARLVDPRDKKPLDFFLPNCLNP